MGCFVLLLLMMMMMGMNGVGVEGVSFGFDWAVAEEDRNDVFSVCGDTTVRKSDGFTFGLAFSTNDSFYSRGAQLSPCDHRLSFTSARLAVFRPKVNEISLLIINANTLNLADLAGYMVAFAGTKFAARSVPHIVKENQHIVTSFTLG